MPSVMKSKCLKTNLNSSLFQIASNWSNDQDNGCQCQIIHIALPQNVSNQHTLVMSFYVISTIVNVSDQNRGNHNEVWPDH
jgi:hypothetical protein